MQIATDANGRVWLVGDAVPSNWNGMPLTVITLTSEQEKQYAALPGDRAGTTFDGRTFAIIPTTPSAALPDPVITKNQLQAALSATGLSTAQVSAAMVAAGTTP